MKNDNSEHDSDSVAEHMRRQNSVLEVLLSHLAHVEATLTALTVKTLSEKNLCTAKGMKDYMQPKIYGEMIAEIKRNLDDL